MFKIVTDLSDPLLEWLRDDPVRPDIPREFRVAGNRFVAALVDTEPQAMVCVSLAHEIPATEDELASDQPDPTTAVFYTIWSYTAGSAAQLLFDTVAEIQRRFPTVHRFVTLSPKTDMAHRFHTRNGAVVLRENLHTINYEYVIGSD